MGPLQAIKRPRWGQIRLSFPAAIKSGVTAGPKAVTRRRAKAVAAGRPAGILARPSRRYYLAILDRSFRDVFILWRR